MYICIPRYMKKRVTLCTVHADMDIGTNSVALCSMKSRDTYI